MPKSSCGNEVLPLSSYASSESVNKFHLENDVEKVMMSNTNLLEQD